MPCRQSNRLGRLAIAETTGLTSRYATATATASLAYRELGAIFDMLYGVQSSLSSLETDDSSDVAAGVDCHIFRAIAQFLARPMRQHINADNRHSFSLKF